MPDTSDARRSPSRIRTWGRPGREGRPHAIWTAAGLALVVAACAQSPKPLPPAGEPGAVAGPAAGAGPAAAPESAAPAPPEVAPAAPSSAAPAGAPAAAPGSRQPPPATVVIEPGQGEGSLSLYEASRRARELKRKAGPPVAVIDNDNLAEYARRGHLTVAAPATPAEEEAKAAPPAEGEGAEVRDEAYWRTRARELRVAWREAVDQASDLEIQAEALRLKFYSEEDVYSRDTRIKPAWDRVLDRLGEARRDADAYQQELETLLEEGRKSGALPGWLREGIELEPEVEPAEEGPAEHEISEPVEVEPPGRG